MNRHVVFAMNAVSSLMLLLYTSKPAEAAPILYTNFASFDAATNITQTADFEGITSSANFVGSTGTFSGITFTGDIARLFVFDQNFYFPGFPSDYLNMNEFGTHYIDITVNAGAVGFDLGSLNRTFGGSLVATIAVTDSSGTTNFPVILPVQPGLAFYGFTSDSLITSARVTGELVVLDNVSIGNAAAATVPEPGTLACTLVGLTALGRRYWKRRRAQPHS